MARQYYPLPAEYVVTGVVGMLLYLLVIYFSVVSVRLGIKSKSTKRFFYCLIVMALFELPRFMAMMFMGNYNSEPAYCFHIFAGIFFFAAFSIVCRQWSGLLQLGSYFRAVYGRHGLIISNILFAIVDVVAVIACATAASLSSFFNSTGFEVITFIEGVRNCVYSVFLAYYGVKLVRRFWHFSLIERQAAAQKSIFTYMINWQSTREHDIVFTKVVLRMTGVLVLSSICFVCRVCMLIAKMAELHSEDKISTPTFSLFGFLWFCLSDFIPRALPSLAFIFLMRTRKPTKDMRRSATHKQEGDEYQFVQLADDESFYNLSDLDRSNSISSATEVMLNADLYAPDSKRSLTPTDAYGIGRNAAQTTTIPHHFTTGTAPGSGAAGAGVSAATGGSGGRGGAGHTLLSKVEADEDANDDDDFYSLDDEEWGGSEPTLLDKFFSALTFSATHKVADREHSEAGGGKGRPGPYDNADIRL